MKNIHIELINTKYYDYENEYVVKNQIFKKWVHKFIALNINLISETIRIALDIIDLINCINKLDKKNKYLILTFDKAIFKTNWQRK